MADKQPPPAHVLRLHPWFDMAHHRWLALCGGIAVLLLAGLTSVAYVVQAKSIVRGATIAGQNVGGLDALAAKHRVQKEWDRFTAQAFMFSGGGKVFTVPVGPGGTDEEVIVDLVELDITAAVNDAYDYGHRGSWWKKARERLSGLLGREHQFGTLVLDQQTLGEAIQENLADQEKPAVNASLTSSDPASFSITPSSTGRSFDYRRAVRQAHSRLKQLQTAPIAVREVILQPDVPSDPKLQILSEEQAPALLALAPVTITHGEKTWTIDRDQLKALLGFQKSGRQITVSLDEAKVSAWLEKIKPEVEIQPQNAKFAIVDGKVQEFQDSRIGQLINVPVTIDQMRSDVVLKKSSSTSLVVSEVKPVTDTTSTNNLGITELVAEGRTNFKGSPVNRRYNLTLGSEKLNGLLIAPGETFSLVTALGKIDKANGWKPELVIKGTKITPEYGGGLCQVATTLFRAALYTGLPIVERRNHSLRISYYEPPIGLDATIYEPKPDLRFTNDYSHYLLLQTRVEGTELIYSFYGTKDGRTVDIPEPRVYNRKGIPPTITTEVDDLKPGEKECQAPGHPGADATATYTVTKVDGTVVVQTFQSHYRPIPVICRIGKKT